MTFPFLLAAIVCAVLAICAASAALQSHGMARLAVATAAALLATGSGLLKASAPGAAQADRARAYALDLQALAFTETCFPHGAASEGARPPQKRYPCSHVGVFRVVKLDHGELVVSRRLAERRYEVLFTATHGVMPGRERLFSEFDAEVARGVAAVEPAAEGNENPIIATTPEPSS